MATTIAPPLTSPVNTLDFVKVTENAALAASRWMGRGERDIADGAAVERMREALNEMSISGRIVIGEGERDEAPMLFIGEELGRGGVEVDIAVDPVEGTNLVANGLPNSIAVMAISERGGLLNAPDTYMKKLAVGPKAAPYVHID
ncbi:MAG: fructose-bisphosphatase class II, partial [Candidatus Eremiobacteraeota bacterium]|nr:fructose-bisphosphatase class II [Candidatus Eremiobacteraeota bacterium]